jgi:septum formation protein
MTKVDSLWRAKAPLLLASQSASRQALLASAGIPFEAIASGIDERAVEAPLRAKGASGADIAAHLARAKAQALAAGHKDRLVLGADQTLEFAGQILAKPATRAEARAQLLSFSGKTHELHSALCLMRDDAVLFTTVVAARLTCRAFGAEFVDRYMAAVGDDVMKSVGAYRVEGLGIHLFEKIEGDHATILGLPLLPLIAYLRSEDFVAE